MARKLPWKRSEPSRAIQTGGSNAAALESLGVHLQRTPAHRERVAKPPTSSSKKSPFTFSPSRVRSPSTSPPPEPPQQEFMIEGLDKDDRYRMVEDEFLTTAQLFTAHMHRAEYDRLKRVAKSRNAATIRAIERPVVAGLKRTSTAARRHEAIRKIARQRKVIGGGDDDAANDLPWISTGLQGLIDEPRVESRAIAATPGPVTLGTRAAAGFTSARTQTTSNTQSRGVATTTTWPRSSSAVSQVPVRRSTEPSRSRNPTANTSSNEFSDDDDDDEEEDDPFGINKRRIRREISREQLRKTSAMPPPRKPSPDSIPSFLR